MRLIQDDRDVLLADALTAIHEARASEPIEVGVVCGASHIPAAARHLLASHGYRLRTAE